MTCAGAACNRLAGGNPNFPRFCCAGCKKSGNHGPRCTGPAQEEQPPSYSEAKRMVCVPPQNEPKTRIGHFGRHTGTPGIQYLQDSNKVPTAKESFDLMTVVHSLHLKEEGKREHALGSSFQNYPTIQMLSIAEREHLINYADQRHLEESGSDLKVPLTESQLEKLIGATTTSKLKSFFLAKTQRLPTEIKLRRCEAHDQCIKFHLDTSLATMQIPLNSDRAYQGARLVFACSDGLHYPDRPAGSCTIHDNSVVHGVTRMDSGVRYGLFFLCDY
eukprot:CAMPEP_0175125652 /NCGR_PEP_ID=MMETSP0087-20121206/3427_1 /TAXON_ID=136419 /ORGANISM="Unknown Unknown, Strain D1" /LENGTH=273 /DNA_ID=CAMNT_0016407497 /DNA_START=166 /DNA_END=987 /DNA_ORIENTATION=+